MNIKDFLSSKEAPPELFWALVIEKGLVQSGIWYIGEGKAEVVGIGTGIPWESDEELVEATDAALSSAIQKLPEEYSEPQKTVFGVSVSWVKNGEISPENLAKIKKLCTELSLTPVGFVVLPEAIAHLYKSEEGSPLNAIVLKSGDKSLELSVFKLGALAGTTEVSRSVSLVDDVIEGICRFEGAAPLPTRFIVYNGKEGDLEEVRQSLIQADWSQAKVGFLHTPQVEVLSTDRKVLATALAGGAEIGNVTAVVNSGEGEEGKPLAEEPKEVLPEEEKTVSAASLGFAVGEDISSIKKEDLENVVSVSPPPIPTQQAVSPQPVRMPVDYLAKSKRIFHSFSRIFPKPVAGQPRGNKGLILLLSILGLGVLALILLWWFAQSARVTVYVTPRRAEENIQVTLDTGGQFDQESSIIPARVLTGTSSGEKTKSTTGTKLIGDKATGAVDIANGNSAAINLSAGTILTSSSGFRFVTDKEASISGQLLPGSPGIATVEVTAYDIGSTYNLAKGEVFSVGNYSKALVAATSTGDFTGGSSQQISAVSEEDRANLEEELKTELSQNVKSDLSAKVSKDELFIGDLAAFDIVSENFDRAVGEQAENLKLSLELSATGLAANRSNLLDYAKNVLGDKAPGGYTLSNDQIDFKFTFVSADEGKYTYDVAVGGNFLPDIDKENLKKTILGKTTTVATDYLNSVPGFAHADVVLKIKFPGPFKTIPRIAKNISIDVKPE